MCVRVLAAVVGVCVRISVWAVYEERVDKVHGEEVDMVAFAGVVGCVEGVVGAEGVEDLEDTELALLSR